MLETLKQAMSAHEKQITEVARILAERGWAEGNGGNFSIRLEKNFNLSPQDSSTLNLPEAFPSLSGRSFLVKTRGSRMRDVASDPIANVSLVTVSEDGSSYLHQSEKGLPTTELASHMAAHAVFVESRAAITTLLHTHPTCVVALSHLLYRGIDLASVLPRMFPEAALLLKDNLVQLPYITPGGRELADATKDALLNVNAVVWSGHGMAAAGVDLASALDLIEVADKAANVALLLGQGLQNSGLTDDQLKSLFDAFNG